jgi:hypothetical protein
MEPPDLIAVLPFANMSGDAEQDYFADGISEDIITALSKLPRLFVIARNSSFTFKGKNVNVQEAGRNLGVRYVLEGSVRKSGDGSATANRGGYCCLECSTTGLQFATAALFFDPYQEQKNAVPMVVRQSRPPCWP